MAVALIISAAGSYWILSQPMMLKAIFTNTWMMIGLFALLMGLCIWFTAKLFTMSMGTAIISFSLFSFVNGVSLAPIFLIYTGASIMTTFAITAGTFLFFSVYGFATKKDLTQIGQMCGMAIWGLILASIVNIFMKSTALYWIVTYAGVAIFMGLIAYKTQELKALYQQGAQNPEMTKKLALFGAFTLYLSFVNLFILLLRIFGKRRD